MKAKSYILIALLSVAMIAGYTNCQNQKSFTSVQGSTTAGNPFSAHQILQALCTTLVKCNSTVTLASCLSGAASAQVDYQVGLPLNTYTDFGSVVQANDSSTILGNTTATDNCVSDINNLSCTSTAVQNAYNSSSSTPYAGIAAMIPVTNSNSCTNVFSTPVPVWTKITTAAAPPVRHAAKSAYDASRNTTIIYGGDNSGTYLYNKPMLSDMWEYDGTTWTQLCASCGPGQRRGHGFVYDSSRNVIVLFGGGNGTTPFMNDVWEWDGATWTQKTPAGTPPSPRHGSYVVYDNVRHRVVVFGGQTSGGLVNDLYEYDGTSWYGPFTPATAPTARADDSMAAAFDASGARMLIYGSLFPASSDDLWAWNGTQWTKICAACTGTARAVADVGVDPVRNKLVVVNGYITQTSKGVNGTWEMDLSSGQWTIPYPTLPPVRDTASFSFDPVRSRFVWFGGNSGGTNGNFNETWEYGP